MYQLLSFYEHFSRRGSESRASTLEPKKRVENHSPLLSLQQFLGLWYVIEQFDTSSTCLTLNYSRESDTQLKVTKSRQLYLLDSLNIDHTNDYTGTLDIPDGENAGKMRVKWPLSKGFELVYVFFCEHKFFIQKGTVLE